MFIRHFRQFQRKEEPYKPYKIKALIEEEVNPEKILEKILIREI